jgi:hypothetical protein
MKKQEIVILTKISNLIMGTERGEGGKIKTKWPIDRRSQNFFSVNPFYLQSVLAHSANCVKTCIQWHVEECSVALLCN